MDRTGSTIFFAFLCLSTLSYTLLSVPLLVSTTLLGIGWDKLEIARNILLLCKDGTKKTEIVYKANLNFKSAGAYLDWLINRKMITKENESFKKTAKGNELLSNLQSTSKLMDLK